MERTIALIGFGEAGSTFASTWAGRAQARAYDRKTDDPAAAAAKQDDFARAGVRGCSEAAEALAGADVVLSLVTADQALAAAQADAPVLAKGALWLDMNSVAPGTKRAARDAVEGAGGRYVDVAVMAPVDPAALGVPLLVSGPHAAAGAEALGALGFTKVRVIDGGVGAASSIKMIRSVMIKGLEALTAECALAAAKAGVLDEVVASLGQGWAQKADYNLERMMIHGLRRAAEMEEAARTLDDLGAGNAMTRATVERQQAIGALGLAAVEGLEAKIAAILGDTVDRKEAA